MMSYRDEMLAIANAMQKEIDAMQKKIDSKNKLKQPTRLGRKFTAKNKAPVVARETI